MHLLGFAKHWWKGSLTHRLLISSIGINLLFLVALGLMSMHTAQRALQHEVEQGNLRIAALAAKNISAQFDSTIHGVRLFSHQLEEPTAKLRHQATAMLKLRRASPLTYRALYLFDIEGRLLIHLTDDPEDLGTIHDANIIADRPGVSVEKEIIAAFEAAKGGTPFRSDVQIVGADQIPVIRMSLPLFLGDRQPRRIFVAEIDLRDLWRRVDQIYLGETGRAFVISKSGFIIAHPDRSYIGKSVPLTLRPVIDGYEGRTEYIDSISGQVMVASYSPVGKQSKWGLVVEQTKVETFAPIKRITLITIGVLLVAIVIVTSVSMLIARGITKPIKHLVEVTHKIAHTGNLKMSVLTAGHDEVGKLAEAFNQMMESLRRAEQHNRKLTEELERRVTERTAQFEAANKELESFAYSVSHDLRAPLRHMSGFTKMFMNHAGEGLDDKGRRYLDVVTTSAELMGELIDDLLQFSRTGRAELRMSQVDMGPLVKEAINQLQPEIEGRNIEWKIGALPEIRADRTMMLLVLVNLVSNAIKFTRPRKEGIIEIGTGGNGEDETVFFVRDNGVGFDMKYVDKLFGVFQRLHRKEDFEGTGIGLANVRRIISRHGGHSWAAAEVDKGATIWCSLPK